MSGDAGRWQFLTRAKLIAGTVGAIIVAGGAYLGACSGAIRVIETPDQLEIHTQDEAERWEATATWRTEHETRFERSLLILCESLGLFPSECGAFGAHDD